MTYGQQLLLTLRRAQLPLVVGVALPLVPLVLLNALDGVRPGAVGSFAFFFGARLYAYGLMAVVLYGAPIYAFLAQIGRANWLTTALVGVAPGVGALLVGIYPSGRLSDANLTVGPMVMACGLFVALATHALAAGAAFEESAGPVTRRVAGRSTRLLARVFVVGAILGQAWTYILVRNAQPGTGGALNFLYGAVVYVIPFLLAAVGCAIYSYSRASKPRGVARVVEIAVFLAVGSVLLIPAFHVLTL